MYVFAAEIMLRNKSRPNFPLLQNQLCTCSICSICEQRVAVALTLKLYESWAHKEFEIISMIHILDKKVKHITISNICYLSPLRKFSWNFQRKEKQGLEKLWKKSGIEFIYWLVCELKADDDDKSI